MQEANHETTAFLKRMSSDHDVRASWEKFLNPDTLKRNLLLGGLYLAAFELLKQSLIGHPKDFCWNGYKDDEEIIDPNYQRKVLSLHKNLFTASALWWESNGAITASDIELLQKIREHRNEIAHDMPRVLGTTDKNIDLTLLEACSHLLFKIDNWWIRNIEIDTNPDFDDLSLTDVDLDQAISAKSVFLDLMLSVATAEDERLKCVYAAFLERFYPDRAQQFKGEKV
jgi:hypothetical protein